MSIDNAIYYNDLMTCKILKLSEEETEEIMSLSDNERMEKLYQLKKFNEEKESAKRYNENRREKRRKNKTLLDTLKRHIVEEEEREKRVLKNKRDTRARYKHEKCAQLNVYLEKDLVQDFKRVCKENDVSQVKIIRDAVESFLKSKQTYSVNKKLGRNDPCFCSSGKKFKQCCLGKI